MGPQDDTLTVVTGASSNHYRCLCNLLRSLDHHETAPVVVYDLGLRWRGTKRSWRRIQRIVIRG